MCYHYSLTKEKTAIALQLDAEWEDEWQPVFHADGFSFRLMPVVTMEEPRKIRLFHWGLIPSWVKNRADAEKLRGQTLNARCETVFEKPSYRNNITRHRCLVPADGFFEWMDFKKKKYPFFVYLDSQELFCFAGIYSRWTDPETAELIQTYSIITTDANPLLSKIHNLKKRMPLILRPNQYEAWLSAYSKRDEIETMMKPFPDSHMHSYTITRLITSRRENSDVPEVMEKASYPELPPL